MRLLKISNGNAVAVENEDYVSNANAVLFLGGLLHTNRISLDGGLPVLLKELCGTIDVYVAYDESSSGVPETVRHMQAFIQDGTIDDYSKKIAALLLRKVDAVEDLTGQESKRAMQSIRLLGYSYGCSVIQQTAQVMADKLREKLEHGGVDNLAEVTYALLKNVSAINIGPTSHIYTYDYDGEHRYVDSVATLDEENGDRVLFSQMFFINGNDKIVQMEAGSYFKSNPNFGVITNSYSDSMLRRVGFDKLSGGTVFPKVKYEFDFEGHHLGLYTNVYSERNGMVTFPSSAMSPIVRQAIKSLGQGRFLSDRSKIIAESVSHDLVKNYEKSIKDFDAFLTKYNHSVYPDFMTVIADVVEKARSTNSNEGMGAKLQRHTQ